MKAHADDGAWAERTAVMTTLKGRESELAGAFERRRGVAASGAHGYANWDDGSLAHGELVPDLAGLLVALGGPRPHPVVGTALRCIADGKTGAGGGTWGLVFAGLLAGHAQRLRAEHDIGFAECCEHYVAASIAAEEALGEVSADIRDITRDLTDTTAIDGAIQRAMATVRAGGDFGSEESQQTEESQTPGVSAEVTTDLAALVLGFDRERFQGDVDIALAAAVLLAEGRSDDTRGVDEDVCLRAVAGVPAERSRVVPGLFVPLEPWHVPGGDVGVSRLCEAIEEGNRGVERKAWRTICVVDDVRFDSRFEDFRRFADDVCAAVTAAGGCDAIMCAGACDDDVAHELTRRCGVSVVVRNLGGWPRGDADAARRLRDVQSGHVQTMCLDASVRGGWDPDARDVPVRSQREALGAWNTRRYLSVTGPGRRIGYVHPLVTAVVCHPVREVAEARGAEVRRLVRRARLALTNGRVIPGGGVMELAVAASLTARAAREGERAEESTGKALAWEAFAHSARELNHIVSQNHGLAYDDASTRAARAEKLCADALGRGAMGWMEISRQLGDDSGTLRLEPGTATGLRVAMDMTRRVLIPELDDPTPVFDMSMRVVR